MTRDELLAQLRALKPLQKPHYCSNLDITTADRELLAEYARLAHGITVEGEWVTEEQASWACGVVRGLVDAGDKLAALSVHWGHFGDQKYTEIDRLLGSIETAARAAGVRIGAIVYDCELLHATTQAALAMHQESHAIAKDNGAELVVWYNRAGVVPAAHPTGWMTSEHHDLTEPGDGLSVALYRVHEIETTREQFRRTVQNAGLGRQVTPFVALGSGYRRTTRDMSVFEYLLDYDPIYSWQLGAEINEPWFGDRPQRFAPWHRAERACFYPPPFAHEYFAHHFVAYVKGANFNQEL